MNVEAVLNTIRGKKALVVGDMMLDVSIFHKTVRKASEFDGTILKEVSRERYPGGAANVAMNCQALGARVTLLGAFGTDSSGQQLYHKLRNWGIEVPTVIWESRGRSWGTTTKRRMYVDGQPVHRIDEDWSGSLEIDPTLAVIKGLQPDIVLFSDYQKGVFTNEEFVKRLSLYVLGNQGGGKPSLLTVNPKPPLVSLLTAAHLISVNNEEFLACRSCLGHDVTHDFGPRISDILIHTMGAAGLRVYSKDRQGAACFGAPRLERPDVVGCGDTVFAAASLATLYSADPLILGKIAVAAGTAKAMKQGTLPVTPEEILNVYRECECSGQFDQHYLS